MKIEINRKGESQTPRIVIDTEGCNYPYAIRNSLILALELDGFDEGTIDEVFGRSCDVVCGEPQDEEEGVNYVSEKDELRVASVLFT